MSSIDDPLHFFTRRWWAWKLVQLAYRMYDADFYERINVSNETGETVAEFDIVSSMYGHGIMSAYAPGGLGCTGTITTEIQIPGYTITCDEFEMDYSILEDE